MSDLQHRDCILLVEDSPSLAGAYRQYLHNEPFDVVHVETGAEAMNFIDASPPSGVLLDLRLPDMDGMDILRHIIDKGLPTVVVVITAHGSVDLAVKCIQAGAADFLEKPFTADRLIITLNNAIERLHLSTTVDAYKDEISRDHYCEFIGSSLAMQAVYHTIDSAAPSKATVFITGESGTGKEICAEAIHKMSPRSNRPFVPLNCAAIPKDLMETEIFGHTKGAFTGAHSERQGAASLADGGTLFLDEICEMDLALQTKLLRFIQTGTFQKVGASKVEKIDIRFVCATNRDPIKEVEEGRFREDLFYRLHVIPIHMPPLRDREADVLLIARKFLADYSAEEGKSFTRFSSQTEAKFLSFGWAGNVRQLQNTVRSIVVLNDGEVVTPELLPDQLSNGAQSSGLNVKGESAKKNVPDRDPSKSALGHASGAMRSLADVEKEAIELAIAACDGNIPRAAALLEISPSTIYRKCQAWKAR